MEPITMLIAGKLSALRQRARLSLEAAAKLTGVSKSMLAQIERGDVSPTVVTLNKIANGFKVPFTVFLEKDEEAAALVRLADIEPLTADNGRFRNYPLFSYDEKRGFEVYAIELDPGCRMEAPAHPGGTEESIMVCCGMLRVETALGAWDMGEGEALRFQADIPHTYSNGGEAMTRLDMVLSYSSK